MADVSGQANILRRLLAEQYGIAAAELEPISPYLFEDRGIYRVTSGDEGAYVLRAFRSDVEASLRGQVAVLSWLEQRGYSAPRARRTKAGRELAVFEGWRALLLTYMPGEPADFSPQCLMWLGACLGELHALTVDAPEEQNGARLPDSRLTPPKDSLLSYEGRPVPAELRGIYARALEAIRRMREAAPGLPAALLHGDCWPRNAVVSEDGVLVLVDWDGTGRGPAVLDLGYLLMACHLGVPDLPAMRPDPERIGAVMQGYCQRRRLTASELDVLEAAVAYDSARRAVLEEALFAAPAEWREHLGLRKAVARAAASKEIAEMARSAVEGTRRDITGGAHTGRPSMNGKQKDDCG